MTQVEVTEKPIFYGPTQPTKPNKSVSKRKKLDKVPASISTKTPVSTVIEKKLMTSKELLAVSRRLLGHSIENPRNCSTFFTWMDNKAKQFEISESIDVENNPDLLLESLNVYQALYLIFNPNGNSQILSCCFDRKLSEVDQGTLVNKTKIELTSVNYTLIHNFEKLLMRFLVCINAVEYAIYLQNKEPEKVSTHQKALLLTYAKTIFSLATENKFNLLSFSMHGNPEDAVRDLILVKRKVNQICLTLKNICRQIVPVCNLPLNVPERWLDTHTNPEEHLDDTELLLHIIRAYVLKSEELLWLTDDQQKQLLDYGADLKLTIHMYFWISTFNITNYTDAIKGQFIKDACSIQVKHLVSPERQISRNQFSKLINILGIVIRTQYLALCFRL